MFSIEQLHQIRRHEIQRLMTRLPPRARVLEIGAGTGMQARILADNGFDVRAIDVGESNYRDESKLFDVQVYDGLHFPFADDSFDVVFSSNVMEHVRDLPAVNGECRRVLRPGGFCLHAMPSCSWRFWTSITHYADAAQRLAMLAGDGLRRGPRAWLGNARHAGGVVRHGLLPERHGERGNILSEHWLFSAAHWRKIFQAGGFDVIAIEPMGLFYTGHLSLGQRLSLDRRQRLSNYLGSACLMYMIRPHENGAA